MIMINRWGFKMIIRPIFGDTYYGLKQSIKVRLPD